MPDQKENIKDLIKRESAKYVSELWENYIQSTSVRRQKLIDYYKQYRGISIKKNYEGLADVVVNETLEAGEAIIAQIFQTIFSESKPVMIMGREETDERQADILEKMLLATLDDMNYRIKILNSIRQMVIYGTCVAELVWKIDEREVMSREKNEFGGIRIEQNMKRVYDNPDLQYIDLLDFACDPGKGCIDDMEWIIIRKRVSWDYIKDMERKGVYGNVSSITKPVKSKTYSEFDNKQQKLQSIGIQTNMTLQPEYELLKLYGRVPIWWIDDDMDLDSPEANKTVLSVIEVINGNTTVRLDRVPFWHQKIPILMSQYIQIDNEAFGIGICEIAERLQMELNDKRNQLLDHASFGIFPPLVIQRAAGINKDQIFWKPNKYINSDLPGNSAIQPLNTGGNPLEILQSEGVCKQDIRNVTGATTSVQGIQAPGEQTAYEVNVLQQRGGSRINVSTMGFTDKFLKPFYRQTYQLLQQFVDTKRAVRTVGAKGIKWEMVKPEDLILDVDFIPRVPSDIENRTIIRNQLIQFISVIAKYYPQTNAYKLVRKIYSLFGFDDVEEIVPEPENEKDQNSLSIMDEIEVLSQGQMMDAKFNEDHMAKLTMLISAKQERLSQLSPEAILAFDNKIEQHLKYAAAIQKAMGSVQGIAGGGPTGGIRGPVPGPQFEQSPISGAVSQERAVTGASA